MRLDQALVTRGLCESRTKAQRRIDAGDVRVNGRPADKAAQVVAEDDAIDLRGGADFVGRGALKLQAALDCWGIEPRGVACMDLGASTGGFTEVLLARGAASVIAIDVGHGQLHPRIASDPRVTSLEGVNAREITPGLWRDWGAPAVGLVVADLSFVSLTQVIPVVQPVVAAATWVCLVKPQFEVGRGRVREGIAADIDDHAAALTAVVDSALGVGLYPAGVIPSPVTGEAGNREYLCWLSTTEGMNPTQWSVAIHDATHP